MMIGDSMKIFKKVGNLIEVARSSGGNISIENKKIAIGENKYNYSEEIVFDDKLEIIHHFVTPKLNIYGGNK